MVKIVNFLCGLMELKNYVFLKIMVLAMEEMQG